MQCINCGKELTSEDRFCNNCGTSVSAVPLLSEETLIEEEAPKTNFNETIPTVEEIVAQPVVETQAPVVETPQVEQPEPQVVEKNNLAPPPVYEEQAVAQPVEAPPVQEVQAAPVAEAPVVEAAPAPAETPQVAEVQHIDVQSHFNGGDSAQAYHKPAVDSTTQGPIFTPPEKPTPIEIEMPVEVPPAPMPIESRKKIPLPALIAIIVVAAIALCGGGIAIGSILSSKPATEPKEDPLPKPEEPIVIADSTTIVFAGSKFDIPIDYEYEIEDGKLSIYNDDLYYFVQVAPTNYAQYSSNIPFLKNNYESLGYTVKEGYETKVGNSQYIILSLVTSRNENVTLFIRSFTTKQSFVCAIGKTDGTFANTKDLNEIETILASSQIVTSRDINIDEDVASDKIFQGVLNVKFESDN